MCLSTVSFWTRLIWIGLYLLIFLRAHVHYWPLHLLLFFPLRDREKGKLKKFQNYSLNLNLQIRIPYSLIKSMSKENTALVIPNAISIITRKKEYLFRSFWDRDECFKIISGILAKNKANGTDREFEINSVPDADNNPLLSSHSVIHPPVLDITTPPSGKRISQFC